MSQKVEATKGINWKGQEKDVVGEKVTGDRRSRGENARSAGTIFTIELGNFSCERAASEEQNLLSLGWLELRCLAKC